jgi:hypothetical protein
MLTKQQILDAVKSGKKSSCIDSRDYSRVAAFFEEEHLPTFGFSVKEGTDWEPSEYTKENVIEQLKSDVEFGFEKALNQRGISAFLMYETVLMWMWVLEDDLQHHSDYPQYGLPLFKAVAIRYGFDNPIGDDDGNEYEYASG